MRSNHPTPLKLFGNKGDGGGSGLGWQGVRVAGGGSDRGWGQQEIRLRSEGATTLPILNCFAIKGVGWQWVELAGGGSGKGWGTRG